MPLHVLFILLSTIKSTDLWKTTHPKVEMHMFQLIRKTHRCTKIRQHTYIFHNQISKQCMHSLHSIVHKTVHIKTINVCVFKYTRFYILLHCNDCFIISSVPMLYLLYLSIENRFSYPEPVFLNLQMFKSVLTWKLFFSDTPSILQLISQTQLRQTFFTPSNMESTIPNSRYHIRPIFPAWTYFYWFRRLCHTNCFCHPAFYCMFCIIAFRNPEAWSNRNFLADMLVIVLDLAQAHSTCVQCRGQKKYQWWTIFSISIKMFIREFLCLSVLQ